jgi:hypothetical protein
MPPARRPDRRHPVVSDLDGEPAWQAAAAPGPAPVVRQLFLLAQDGKTNASGRPRPLQAAALAWEFADTIRFTSPPRLLSGILHLLARATGHRGLDPDLLGRELPVVDLEPIPAELGARIPGLAAQPARPGARRAPTGPPWPNSTTVTAGR